MSTADEHALLRAIAANPADDTPRLVFADFLDEHGDREMAAFIRASIVLADTDEADAAYPERLARVRRAGVLTRAERRAWLDAVPGGRVTFHRGLIAGVAVPADVHAKQAEADWERVPIEQLNWQATGRGNAGEWGDAVGAALATRPELERVRTLITHGGAAFLDPLMSKGSTLAGLRALTVDGGFTQPERMNLPALDSLCIRGSEWPPIEWEPIVQATRKTLIRLHLEASSGNRAWYEEDDWAGGNHLADLPLTYGVAWLDLASLHSYGNVDRVWCMGERTKTKRAILQASELGVVDLSDRPSLRRLHVEMGTEGWVSGELSHLESAGNLTWLSSNGIFDEEAELFATGTRPTNLRRLSIHISDRAILEGEYCRRLHRFEWGNGSHEVDLASLLAADLPELRWLTLRGRSAPDNLAILPTARNMPNLCTLILVGEPFNANELASLLHRLANSPGLPHLSLIGVGRSFERHWWVVGNDRATPVHDGVDPIWRDWWEIDPTETWF